MKSRWIMIRPTGWRPRNNARWLAIFRRANYKRLMDKISLEIETLISRLHARGRLRVWSIIISIFGDSIQPHGGTVAASTLGAITEGLNIEPGAMRSALSRLGKEGWIERHKIGRNSQYTLTNKGVQAFLPAAQRIYSADKNARASVWTLAVTGSCTASEKSRLHENLLRDGFIGFGRGTFLLAGPRPENLDGITSCLILEGSVENIPDWVKETVGPPEDFAAFTDILTGFSNLKTALETGAVIRPEQAIVARTLLIHDWRRAVLRHRDLPAEFYPDNWPAEPCRAFVAELYQLLSPAAEKWLAQASELTDQPSPDVLNRFH